MGKKYTRAETLEMLKIASLDMDSFYKQKFINYQGLTIDTHECYTEVIAKYLCENIELLYEIECIRRRTSYSTPTHNGGYNIKSDRKEDHIAKAMFRQSRNENIVFDKIGTVVDYQVPLKNVQTDKAGKIDLLSYDSVIARVLELKEPNSTETMLRCVLEGYTYLKILSHGKCKSDFGFREGTSIKTSPLVFVGSIQEKEYLDPSRVYLHKLMRMLDITPFFIEEVAPSEFRVVR